MYGAREGTIEYPGSAAGPNAAPTYVARSNDTVDGIAQRFGVSSQTIIDRNKLQAPYTLRAGQAVEIPGARVVASQEAAPTQATSASTPSGVKRDDLPPPSGGTVSSSPSSAARPAPGEPTPLSPPPAKDVTVAATTPPPPAPTPPPAGPKPRFQWPVKGKILTPYGTAPNGQKSDGIEIAAEKGAPVKAADGGTVVYAGSDVAHLGNLLLIQHSAGYITAYGNNESLSVKKGDTVKKGQTIARAGSSGNAATPRVHFEIRRGSNRTVDPMTMLPAQ